VNELKQALAQKSVNVNVASSTAPRKVLGQINSGSSLSSSGGIPIFEDKENVY